MKKIVFCCVLPLLVLSCSSKEPVVKKSDANQLVNAIPPVSIAPEKPPQTKYNVALNNQSAGPFALDELKQMADKGQLTKESFVWKEGMTQWETAGSIAELASLFPTKKEPPLITPADAGRSAVKYNVAINGVSSGPFTLEELKQMAQDKKLTRESLVWKEDMSQWVSAGSIAELASFFPPVQNPQSVSSADKYFIVVNNKPSEPFSLEELKQIAKNRSITRNSLVWKEGLPQWVAAETIPELAALFPTIPPPPPQTQNASSPLYYIAVNGLPTGPFTMEEFTQKAQSGQISRNTLIWKEDMPQWASAGAVPEISHLFATELISREVKYHIAVNGLSTGPFTMEELKQKAAAGQIKKSTQVWKSGMSQWAVAGSIAELNFLFAQ